MEITKRELKHFKPLPELINVNDALGKTIKGVAMEAPGIIVSFTDGTVLIIGVSACDECGERGWIGSWSTYTDCIPQSLLRAGVITREQFDSWAAEKEKERTEKNLKSNRKEYERLKKLFEPTPCEHT